MLRACEEKEMEGRRERDGMEGCEGDQEGMKAQGMDRGKEREKDNGGCFEIQVHVGGLGLEDLLRLFWHYWMMQDERKRLKDSQQL